VSLCAACQQLLSSSDLIHHGGLRQRKNVHRIVENTLPTVINIKCTTCLTVSVHAYTVAQQKLHTTLYKNHTIIRLRLSVCLSIWGKDRRNDENRKGTMECGSGMGLSWGLVGCVRERKKGDTKTCFSAGRAAHVHYFKEIPQGAPQPRVWGAS